MTVLIAIALLMSALSASAQLCSVHVGRVTCKRLTGDISQFIQFLNNTGENELLAVKAV